MIRDYNKWDENNTEFIRFYAKKWRAKSIFQILLQYRAAKYYDLYSLSQQVHLYNQKFVHNSQPLGVNYKLKDLSGIDTKAQAQQWLGDQRLTVWKLPFRLDEIPFFDTSYMCDPYTNPACATEQEESWDAPLRWRETISGHITHSIQKDTLNYANNEAGPSSYESPKSSKSHTPSRYIRSSSAQLINLPFSREPSSPVYQLRPVTPEPTYEYSKKRETDFKNELKQLQEKNASPNVMSPRVMSPKVIPQSPRVTPPNIMSPKIMPQSPRPMSPNIMSPKLRSPSPQVMSPGSKMASPPLKAMSPAPSYVAPSPSRFSYTSPPASQIASPVNKLLNRISKPANEDFEYISSPQGTPKLTQLKSTKIPPLASPRRNNDPITELEKIGRHTPANEDDPPFNFQGLLRKTKFNRDSMKRAVENISVFNVNNKSKISENEMNGADATSIKNNKNMENYKVESEGVDNKSILSSERDDNRFATEWNGRNDFVCEEIAPGITLEGIVVDL